MTLEEARQLERGHILWTEQLLDKDDGNAWKSVVFWKTQPYGLLISYEGKDYTMQYADLHLNPPHQHELAMPKKKLAFKDLDLKDWCPWLAPAPKPQPPKPKPEDQLKFTNGQTIHFVENPIFFSAHTCNGKQLHIKHEGTTPAPAETCFSCGKPLHWRVMEPKKPTKSPGQLLYEAARRQAISHSGYDPGPWDTLHIDPKAKWEAEALKSPQNQK